MTTLKPPHQERLSSESYAASTSWAKSCHLTLAFRGCSAVQMKTLMKRRTQWQTPTNNTLQIWCNKKWYVSNKNNSETRLSTQIFVKCVPLNETVYKKPLLVETQRWVFDPCAGTHAQTHTRVSVCQIRVIRSGVRILNDRGYLCSYWLMNILKGVFAHGRAYFPQNNLEFFIWSLFYRATAHLKTRSNV